MTKGGNQVDPRYCWDPGRRTTHWAFRPLAPPSRPACACSSPAKRRPGQGDPILRADETAGHTQSRGTRHGDIKENNLGSANCWNKILDAASICTCRERTHATHRLPHPTLASRRGGRGHYWPCWTYRGDVSSLEAGFG
jgi:hypothetical protein